MLTLPACAATNLYTPSVSPSAGYDKCVYDVHDAVDDDDGDDAAADDDNFTFKYQRHRIWKATRAASGWQSPSG